MILFEDALGTFARVVAGGRHEITGHRHAPDAGIADQKSLADFGGFLVGILHMDTPKIAEILRAGLVAGLGRGFAVQLGHLHGHLRVGFEIDVGIMMARRPFERLGTADAGDPDRRMGLLQRPFERIHDPEMIMLALPSERAGRGPGLDHEVVRFLEALAIMHRIGVGGPALDTGAAHESRDQPSARDHVDLGQFLGQTQWIVEDRQRVSEQDDLRPFS